jgi:hypothetical protein
MYVTFADPLRAAQRAERRGRLAGGRAGRRIGNPLQLIEHHFVAVHQGFCCIPRVLFDFSGQDVDSADRNDDSDDYYPTD